MRTSLICAAVALLAGSALTEAAIRTTTSSGTSLYRTDNGNIQFVVNTSVKAGAKNSQGKLSITSDSDVMKALTAAAAEWNAVSTASVHFAPLTSGSTANNPSDGVNVITIQDTAENRSVVGDALAVTLYEFMASGAVTDTDIILNPDIEENGQQMPFSTTRAANSYDLQTIVSHEMGHALGSDHSGLLSATMFQASPPNETFVGAPKTPPSPALSTDDISFVSAVYPSSSAAEHFGTINGAVQSGSSPISGAIVVAVSPTTGKSVCALSKSDGTYSLTGLPSDTYVVYAQPLDGPVQPGNLASLNGKSVNTTFRTAFYGGNSAPSHLKVTPGTTSQATIMVPAGTANLGISLMAIATPNLNSWSWTGVANTVTAGQTVVLLISGTGIDDSITASDVDVFGPGVTVKSVKDSGISLNGSPALAVEVQIADSSSAAQATVVLHKGSEAAAWSGGLLIAADSSSSTGGGATKPSERESLHHRGKAERSGGQETDAEIHR